MSVTTSTSVTTHLIKVSDRFDFNVQNEFRQAYELVDPGSYFVIDFSDAKYMDSSALGMLLLLREYAGGDNSQITLAHCCPEILNILEISNFHKLFQIS